MAAQELSLGDALKLFLSRSPLKPRLDAIRIEEKWEQLMGKTIAKYTGSLQLVNKKLIITTTAAPLKQELSYSREKIIRLINEAFGEEIVKEVIIK